MGDLDLEFEQQQAERVRIMRSCVGSRLISWEADSGSIEFKFDNGVRVMFPDGWSEIELAGKTFIGGTYVDAKEGKLMAMLWRIQVECWYRSGDNFESIRRVIEVEAKDSDDAKKQAIDYCDSTAACDKEWKEFEFVKGHTVDGPKYPRECDDD